jgi:very-short-patch-repair endonuclease
MLYLVLGFLEWFEDGAREHPRHAPLLTTPVSIARERSREGGPIQTSLDYTGEDREGNLCLEEKLRQDFSLELPRWNGQEEPEHYFQRVQRAVAQKPGWRVRRWATVCLLYFGKLLMYLDLDPEHWPRGKEIDKHPVVHELFEGPRSESPLAAEEYDIDSPQVSLAVPLLICDADSSQHSALVDALSGKNLVIQGPPGTGKSQTITNLIAAALSKGKTVLFVSEKLAALEVVRRNLDKVGLGTFCLELHSHRTQKRELIKDLEERLHKKGTFRDPGELEQKLQALNRNKQELLDYVALMNSSFGALGQTIFEILWRRDRLRSEISLNPELVEGILLEGAERLTVAEVERHRQVLATYSEHLQRVGGGSLSRHPWFGVRNSDLDLFEQEALASLLTGCLAKCGEIEGILAECGPMLGLGSQDSPEKIKATVSRVSRELPSLSGSEVPQLLRRLAHEEDRGVLSKFLSDLASLQDEAAALSELVTDWVHLDRSRLTELLDFARRAEQLGILAWTTPTLGEWASRADALDAAIRDALPFVVAVLDLLEGKLSFSLSDAGTLVEGIEFLMSSTPFESLPFRRSGLEEEAAAVAVRAAAREAADLRSLRDSLAADFHLESPLSMEDLRRHLTAAEGSGLWSRWFGGSYRASRRYFRSIRKGRTRVKHEEIVQGFRRLVAFQARKARFDAHSCWSFVGHLDDDIDGPWNHLVSLVDWHRELHSRLPGRGGFAEGLVRALVATSTERLRDVAARAQGASHQVSCLRVIESELPEVTRALTEWDALAVGKKAEGAAAELHSLVLDLRSMHASLQAIGIHPRISLRELPGLVSRVNSFRQTQASLASCPEARALLAEHFPGSASEVGNIASTLDLAKRIAASALPVRLKAWLFQWGEQTSFTKVTDWCTRLGASVGQFDTCWKQFEERSGLDVCRWFRVPHGNQLPGLDKVRSRAEEALKVPGELSAWVEYLRAKAEVGRLHLDSLAILAQHGSPEPTDLLKAYEYALYNSLARRALGRYPLLMRFNGLTHERIRRDFVRLDEEVMQLFQARVAAIVDSRQVPYGVHQGSVKRWTNIALLQHVIAHPGSHVKIRELVARTGGALAALKPCFMMGPLSVAQYLAPGQIEFDLVVMDEASQLKPEDAIGAIARGRQVVIVGDKQQLPPTTFFEHGLPDDELADLQPGAAEEGESILEVAQSVFHPVRRLNWHYRSRHHSLIAFSNREFYGDGLKVFPAAYTTAPDLGVRYVSVENGVWEGRRNPVEGRRVVDAVLEHMVRHFNESLGVATMNFDQSELIDEMLDREFERNPTAQRYLEKWQREAEPFFVKNLENVQGDERDVIFISMTYGRDGRGNFYQRFGPINSPKGYRRLNVLFTRAKKRTVVFSSMDPSWIHILPHTGEEGSTQGTRILKAYLEYAKTGALQLPEGSRGGPESDFEISVGQVLQASGYEIATQVGVAGFYIDIAVRNPGRSGAYLLGVECDGASYHSGRSARDRDRLRQLILENLGWKIHRIWSTDWYKARQREVDRLLSRIQALLRDEERERELRRASLVEAYRQRQGRLQLEPETDAELRTALKEELRRQLQALEETIARECPDTLPERRLLRHDMIELFLQKRPTTQSEWFALIPQDLRSGTDPAEARRYLPKVLEIFADFAG